MHLKSSEKAEFTESMFDSLVKNAIDFLERATAEIEERPKYSIINFFNAVELFLKARLMKEHWALVIAKPEVANIRKFRDGDLPSVTLEQSIHRLRNIAGESLTDVEISSFNELRKHRNKLVHFFHPRYAGAPDESTLEDVVVELCKGWLFLHRLITVKWVGFFGDYEEEINKLASEMNRLKKFLRAKYEVLQPDIEKEIGEGKRYTLCFSCSFRAARIDYSEPPLSHILCKVCGWRANRLIVKCADCPETIELDEGQGVCESCDYFVSLDDLIEQFGAQNETTDPKEALAAEDLHAYCNECEHVDQPTVVPFNERWLCLNCLSLHSNADYCDWCNAFIASPSENTYVSGCMWCEGMLGHHKDE
jgi:hypothetical protein